MDSQTDDIRTAAVAGTTADAAAAAAAIQERGGRIVSVRLVGPGAFEIDYTGGD